MSYNLLGAVVYSILSETQFQDINGEGWILMDGRNIEGSELYQRTGMKNIPDARGVFIRGMNCNRNDKHKDTDGNRPLGHIQDDTTRLPRIRHFSGITSENGNHNHKYNVGNTVNGHKYKTKGGEFWPKHGPIPVLNTQHAGNHQHNVTINYGGDPETRPRNIALYVYIKINN